jgi:hypothetical protein
MRKGVKKLQAKKDKGIKVTSACCQEKIALASLIVAAITGDVLEVTAAKKNHNDAVTVLNRAWDNYTEANEEFEAAKNEYSKTKSSFRTRFIELMNKSVIAGSVDSTNTNTNAALGEAKDSIIANIKAHLSTTGKGMINPYFPQP